MSFSSPMVGGTAEIAMAHPQRGSVAVAIGQAVELGEVIGKAGNSGYSTEPHRYINAQLPGTRAEPFSGDPVAMRFNGRFLARNDRPWFEIWATSRSSFL